MSQKNGLAKLRRNEKLTRKELMAAIDALSDALSFDHQNILQEAVRHSPLFMLSCRARYCAEEIVNMSRARYQDARNELFKTVRSDLLRKSAGRVTVAEVESRLDTDELLKSLQRRKEEAEAVHELSKGLVDAFRHRKDQLRLVADLLLSEGRREKSAIPLDTENALAKKYRKG